MVGFGAISAQLAAKPLVNGHKKSAVLCGTSFNLQARPSLGGKQQKSPQPRAFN